MRYLKIVSDFLTRFLSGLAQIRAASSAARMHRYDEAAAIIKNSRYY